MPVRKRFSSFIRRSRALWRMVLAGDLGLARAYMDDDCRSHDIRALLDLGTQNEAALAEATSGSLLSRCLERIGHFRRVNARRGSRRNIAAHYNLGNGILRVVAGQRHELFLSAVHASEQTLEEAQDASPPSCLALAFA